MPNIHEELKNSLKLLKQEWQEDLDQFKKKFLYTSISDKKKEGICWYPVQLKKSKLGFGDRWIVEMERFDSGQSHLFQSGKSVSVFTNLDNQISSNARINGVINQVKNDVMTITFQVEELPDWLNKGKTGVDLLFDEASYREMEAALKAVIKSEKSRLGELKEVLLGDKEAGFLETNEVLKVELNPSQEEALLLVASAKDVAIIHGPPGTGKTTTLVASIKRAVEKYKQVLVCAPSNAAVDLLVEKISEAGINTLRIGHPARVEDHILNKTLDAKISMHDSYKDLKKLKRKAEEYRKLGQKYKRTFGPEERMQKRRLFDEAKRCKDEADHLEEYITFDVFQQTKVIASTLVGASNSVLKGMKFPVVFIDEAAQGLEAATWIPVQKAEKVVLAGDHFQLPPTIKSFEAAKGGLSETLFEKIIKRQPKASKMLTLQYRMPDMIMGFSSRYFYEGRLLAAENTKTQYLDIQEPVLEYIDTAGSGYMEQLEEESLSTYNSEEAKFSLDYLEEMIKRIGIAKIKTNHWSIGLIAPYKAQVRKFNELLFDTYNFPNLRSFSDFLTIDSIDGFQGQERDIIIISLVRSNPKGEIGFLSDTRRMNVALTRAKRKLVVIGDSATLSVHPFYQAFLDYIDENGCYRSIYEFIE
jgi:ATP-dependent RNA/DNA helicase IGHMBP2